MSHENIKMHCHKKVIVCFYNLGKEKFVEVAAFVIFPTSVMVLFEIHQSGKSHFLNELCISFKNTPSCSFKYFKSSDVIVVKKKYTINFCSLITWKNQGSFSKTSKTSMPSKTSMKKCVTRKFSFKKVKY